MATAYSAPPLDRSGSAPLDDEDRAILANVPQSLADGLRAFAWWEATDRAKSYPERFPLVRTSNPADSAYGFFGSVAMPAGPLPVMGLFQEMFYDRPKGSEIRLYRDQLREFVRRYFMRVTDFRRPAAFVPGRRTESQTRVPALSWCPQRSDAREGFGYSQLYYKLAGSGRMGKFPREKQAAIVDLATIGPVYEWIVVSVAIFDFNLDVQPLGAEYPYIRLPMREETMVIVAPEFVRFADDPEPGILGKYGFGYALLRSPTRGVLAYGPGQFDAGFQTIDFKVFDNGEIKTCLAFTVNRPQQILNLSLNPLRWGLDLAELMSLGAAGRFLAPTREALAPGGRSPDGFDPVFSFISMANLLTGGLAASELCISREQLEMDMLVQHFMEHYSMVAGSLVTWRRVSDWLDPATIPDWVLAGRLL